MNVSGKKAFKKLLTVGRLSEVKGHRYLICAVNRIRQRHPGIEVKIAGHGELKSSLERYVIDKGLVGHVRFVGEQKNVEALMHEADVFVFPSLHEGFGLALVEAMACGLPVIATEAVKSNDLIEDGKSGFLVPVKDAEAIAEKVKQILDDSDLASTMGQAGCERIKTLFSSRKMAARYMELYRRLMTEKGYSPI